MHDLEDLQAHLEAILSENAKQVVATCLEVCRRHVEEERRLGKRQHVQQPAQKHGCLSWIWRDASQEHAGRKNSAQPQLVLDNRNIVQSQEKCNQVIQESVNDEWPPLYIAPVSSPKSALGKNGEVKSSPAPRRPSTDKNPPFFTRSQSRASSIDASHIRVRSGSVDTQAGNLRSPKTPRRDLEQIDTISILTSFLKIRRVLPDGERRASVESSFDEALVAKVNNRAMTQKPSADTCAEVPMQPVKVDKPREALPPARLETSRSQGRNSKSSSDARPESPGTRKLSDNTLGQLSPRDVFGYLNDRAQLERSELARRDDPVYQMGEFDGLVGDLREPPARSSITSSVVNEFLAGQVVSELGRPPKTTLAMAEATVGTFHNMEHMANDTYSGVAGSSAANFNRQPPHEVEHKRRSVNTALAMSECFREDLQVPVGTVEAARVYKERNAELGRCLAELTAELSSERIFDSRSLLANTANELGKGDSFQELLPSAAAIRG